MPTEQGASRGPRGPRQYNLEKGLGIIGQPHRDLRPPGAATQSTGTGCIACVHPTQVHAFYRQGALPRRALSFSPPTQYLGLVSGGPDQPTVRLGGPGLELYYGLRGGIFIAEVTSIHPSIHHSQAVGSCCCALPGFCSLPLTLSFSRPSAEQAFLPPLPCDFFFFFPLLHPGTFTLLQRTFFPGHPSSYPHSHLTIYNFKSWTGHLSICWVATLSHQSGLDPRPSILETL